jgi:hypothetical protein
LESQYEARLEQAIKRMESQLEMQLEQATDKAVQEADDAVEDLTKQADQLMKKLASQQVPKPHFMDVPLKPSKLFPNVDINAIKQPSNTINVPVEVEIATEGVNEAEIKHTDWDKYGPPTGGVNFNPNQSHLYGNYNNGLPMVCHNDILKRVSVQYPCREQSCTWYEQISSGLEQYGVYLISADEFRKDKSLCQTSMYGIEIDSQ